MAITLGQIVIELLAGTAGFTSGMDKASYAGKKAAKDIEKSFETMGDKVSGSLSGVLGSFGEFGNIVGEMGKKLSEAFEGIGSSSTSIGATISVLGGLSVVALAATAALASLAKEGAEITERLSQVSQKTGISVNQLQVLEAAGGSVGLSLEDMVTAFRKFDQVLTGNGKNAGLAQTTLKALGITAKDNKEALLQAADAFKAMEDGPAKAADAVALFGKSGLAMIPFLNKGREGILEFQDAVDTFGPKITNEGIKNTEDWKVSVEKLSLAWKNLAVTISDEVLPAMTKGAEGVAGLLRGVSVLTGTALEAGKAALSGDSVSGAIAGYLASRQQTGPDKGEEERLKNKMAAIDAYKEHYKEIYDLEKAGGQSQLEYAQAQQAVSAATQQQDFKTAARLEETLPMLKAAADAEALRAVNAARVAATYAAIEKGFDKGAPKPLQQIKLPKVSTALWNTTPEDPLAGAPGLSGAPFADLSHAMDGLVKDTSLGKAALDEFYKNWSQNSKGTVDGINADYDAQLNHFQGLLALGQISEEQAKDVYLKIQTERYAGLKRLQQENGESTFSDAWQDMFTQLAASGKDFARSITSDIGGAIQGLNEQLAKFAVTGKGLNLKEVGQSLGANLVSSALKKSESGLFSSVAGLFGVNGGKQDGSTQQLALWVQDANGTGATGLPGIGTLPLGGLGQTLLGNFGGGTSGAAGAAGGAGGILSTLGGFAKSIGGIFGGFLAGGGDTQPGRAYIVGEKRPELFVPGQAGRVVPSVTNGSSTYNHTSVNMTINTPDADSFRRSQGQISSSMGAAASRGQSRNGR